MLQDETGGISYWQSGKTLAGMRIEMRLSDSSFRILHVYKVEEWVLQSHSVLVFKHTAMRQSMCNF